MINQTMKTLIVMLSGKPITIDEFTTTLKGEVATEILPQYIWRLKKLGANITAQKNGQRVVSYTLMNPQDMRVVVEQAQSPKKKEVMKSVRLPVRRTPTHKVETIEMNEDGEVTSVVDPSFDEFNVSDLI